MSYQNIWNLIRNPEINSEITKSHSKFRDFEISYVFLVDANPSSLTFKCCKFNCTTCSSVLSSRVHHPPRRWLIGNGFATTFSYLPRRLISPSASTASLGSSAGAVWLSYSRRRACLKWCVWKIDVIFKTLCFGSWLTIIHGSRIWSLMLWI